MKNIAKLLLLLLLFNSCASILNGKQQKVNIKTKKPNSIVYVNGIKQGKGRTVLSKLNRDSKVKQIKLVTEGYKDQYIVHYQNQKSPLYIASWVPFGILFYPPLMDYGPKSFNYKKDISVKEKLIPITEKETNQKYLFVKNTEFNIEEKDLKIKKIRHRSLKKNKKNKFKEIDSNLEDVKFNNSIFTESLNDLLVKYKYTDSTNTIFKNKSNSAYLSAKISKLDLQLVYQSAAKRTMTFLKAVVELEWDLLDVYGQSIYKKKYKTTSGEFSIDFNGSDSSLLAVNDAISGSFLNFINNKSIKEHLKKSNIINEIKLDKIALSKNEEATSIEDAVNATVTIKVENGHGSGFAISDDGYILTNFHVVANSKDDISIITKNKKELKAKLIRQNESLDLALLKVETNFNKHFIIPSSKNYNIGNDIFLIGTPKSIELGNTLTKGIISGDRESNDIKLIQTDASINSGNSGGPLISKNGKLLGVVNAKLSGIGVEGIGFAIPANLISKALSLE